MPNTAASNMLAQADSNQILEVTWESGVEQLDLSAIVRLLGMKNPGRVRTLELRKENGMIAVYEPLLSGTGLHAFALTYQDGGKWLVDGDEGTDAQGAEGTANYQQNNDGHWTCSWRAVADTVASATYECTLVTGEVARLSRSYIKTLRDPAFRKMILGEKPSCAITKETNPAVLDAAHILGVGDGGSDSAFNGIVLRRDLHALFDAHIIRLDINGIFSMHPVLGSYTDIFSMDSPPPSLKNATEAVVKENIAKRNALIPTKK